MGSTPPDLDIPEMVDEMVNGNLTERENGRDKFVTATLSSQDEEGGQLALVIRPLAPLVIPTVQCVQINCDEDRLQVDARYVTFDVAVDDEIFKISPSQITTWLDLPIIIDVLSSTAQMAANPIGLLNYAGAYLYRPADPEERDWGEFFEWRRTMMSIGTVIVAREDKKDITVRQVQVLVQYLRFEIDEEHRLLTRVAYGRDQIRALKQERKAFIKDRLSRTAFEAFFEKFKVDKGYTDRSWLSERSPYEV